MTRKLILLLVSLGITTVALAGPPNRFDAQLSGFNAGGAVVDTNAAGIAKVQIVDDNTAIYYQINVSGLDGAFMAHIHVAPEPVQLNEPAGPPVFWFFGGPPPVAADNISEPINGSLARGYIVTASDLSSGTIADLISAIREGRASIIVHTIESPAGELRGTLQ
jgi:hypothetical protein